MIRLSLFWVYMMRIYWEEWIVRMMDEFIVMMKVGFF